eukprot:scaffold13166_cov46-Phaeocystis_antarctica.AAC.1
MVGVWVRVRVRAGVRVRVRARAGAGVRALERAAAAAVDPDRWRPIERGTRGERHISLPLLPALLPLLSLALLHLA